MAKNSNSYQGKLIGRFRVRCKQRCVTSPDYLFVIGTSFIIIAPSIGHCIFAHSTFPSLAAQIIVDIFYLISMCISLFLLWKTTFTDPGIIPRMPIDTLLLLQKQRDQQQLVNSKNAGESSSSSGSGNNHHIMNNLVVPLQNPTLQIEQRATVEGGTLQMEPNDSGQINAKMGNGSTHNEGGVVLGEVSEKPKDAKEYFVNVNGVEIILSECRTCMIVRPPRTFHCSRCDACIEVHDHHCPWVGNCIGKRNHKYFVSFLHYTSIHAAFTAITGIICVVNAYPLEWIEMFMNVPLWIGMIYGAFIFVALFPFGFYHWYLFIRGRTTNEEVRHKYDRWGKNPFDQGAKRNCAKNWKYYQSTILHQDIPSDAALKQYEIFERNIESQKLFMDLDMD